MQNSDDKMLAMAGYCGLFCYAFTSYIGTSEDPKRLELLARRAGGEAEDFACEGCRSAKLSKYCRSCAIKKCAQEKRIDFCHECDAYPCEQFKEFEGSLPHRHELRESLQCLKQCGTQKWAEEMREDYACGRCGAINSAYDVKCRSCGGFPGNGYVKRHLDEIMEKLKPKGD